MRFVSAAESHYGTEVERVAEVFGVAGRSGGTVWADEPGLEFVSRLDPSRVTPFPYTATILLPIPIASPSLHLTATLCMTDSQSSAHTIFPRWVNYLLPLVLLGGMGAAMYVPVVVFGGLSSTNLNIGYKPEQPVPYSHQLHVGELGMDCTYCHTSVYEASFAAVPTTQVCMNCHNPDEGEAGIHKGSAQLQALYASYESGEPVEWVKVHDLADYAYFNHSAHVNKGVSCYSCHGRVDKMDGAGVWQVHPLSMGWCLDCHRAPEQHLRPLDQITNQEWTALDDPTVQEAIRSGELAEGDADAAQLWLGARLKDLYQIHDHAYMQSCSTCHR